MFDILKQSVFVSLGLANLAREKVEELAAEVSRRAKLSESETKEFRDELMQRSEEARKNLATEIDQRIDHTFVQLGILKAGVKKTAESARDELQHLIDQRIDAALQRLQVARSEDIQALMARIDLLERKVSAK